MTNLPGYDVWKTREPEEPYCDDHECTCTTYRKDMWCPVHGKDPDEEYEKRRDDDYDDPR